MGSTKARSLKWNFDHWELSEKEKSNTLKNKDFRKEKKRKKKHLDLDLWMFNNHSFLFLLVTDYGKRRHL